MVVWVDMLLLGQMIHMADSEEAEAADYCPEEEEAIPGAERLVLGLTAE